jgi:hypothetical protein
MDYTLQAEIAGDHAKVSLAGDITLEKSKAILIRLWDDPVYAQSHTAIWDLSGCDTLPEFNELIDLAQFIANEKAGRGPRAIAFTSPAFSSSTFASAFQGFEYLVGLSVNFLANEPDAAAWLARACASQG